MRASILTGTILAIAVAAAAATHKGDISVTDGQVRANLGGSANSAAYMVIENHGSRPDTLVSVNCACADKAEAHISRMVGQVMTMAPAGPVTVPAHGRVVFAPDGLHVMLMGVKRPLVAGHRQAMTLRFAHGGAVTANFEVRERITSGAPMGGM
jgi:periplasmic copper chaperone A